MLRFIVVSLYVFFWCWFRFYLATELFVECGNIYIHLPSQWLKRCLHKFRACAYVQHFQYTLFRFLSFCSSTRSNSFAHNRSVQKIWRTNFLTLNAMNDFDLFVNGIGIRDTSTTVNAEHKKTKTKYIWTIWCFYVITLCQKINIVCTKTLELVKDERNGIDWVWQHCTPALSDDSPTLYGIPNIDCNIFNIRTYEPIQMEERKKHTFESDAVTLKVCA